MVSKVLAQTTKLPPSAKKEPNLDSINTNVGFQLLLLHNICIVLSFNQGSSYQKYFSSNLENCCMFRINQNMFVKFITEMVSRILADYIRPKPVLLEEKKK